MAQPQPQTQPQAPPRAFSPAQHSPSPVAATSAFALPPNKRVRTDGSPSQPESPYPNSPYAMSPAASTPPGSAGSPPAVQVASALPNAFTTPYTNGISTPSLSLPEPRSASLPPIQTSSPAQASTPQPQYTTATMAPMPNTPTLPVQTPGVMGPPQRPAERPAKDYEYDVTDSLAGTGIDLRAEEQFMTDMYSNYFDPEARSGFPQHPPGPKSSFYGAGPANQPAQPNDEQDQRRIAAQAAEKAWQESAMRLGVQRAQEVNDPFLAVALLHRRADKIAKEHHLTLNLDLKNPSTTGNAGKMRQPNHFSEPKVHVQVKPGPDAAMIHTTASMIPHDAFLVDQLALLSIATKLRLRDLVEDASGVATHRQKTSHGDIPEEWAAAAAPLNVETPEVPEATGDDVAMTGAANGTSSLKRPAETANAGSETRPKKLAKISSYMTTTMRDLARQEREWEEARLRKRQKRKDGVTDTGATTPRAGSVAPGTPGSVAPEPEKTMTKKEMKKNQAAKALEASNHANQNITSSMFAGSKSGSKLFGGKKKAYDWMNIGRGGGSGTSTPKASSGGSKGSALSATSPAAGNMALTTEGRNRLGTWREDKEKGKNIQLRDWITVLERDGRESRALQLAYVRVDLSGPR